MPSQPSAPGASGKRSPRRAWPWGGLGLFGRRRCRKVGWKLGSTPSGISVDRDPRPLTLILPVSFQNQPPDQATHSNPHRQCGSFFDC